MARVSQRSFHPNYLGYKVRTTTVVARNPKKKISSNILAGFKLHNGGKEERRLPDGSTTLGAFTGLQLRSVIKHIVEET